MAPPTAVPATPPTFHFKIRLVDATGTAFAARAYQLWWGGKLAQEGQTGADGVIEADVDDNYDSGLVDLGERDGSKFVARLTIPVDVVPPPPPPPNPVAPAPKKAAPPKPPPRPGAEWTDEADPPPPMPDYPRGGEENEEGWKRYKQQQKKWDDWSARREERMAEARKWKRDSEDMRDRQAGEAELRRKYHDKGGPGSASPARDAAVPPMPDEEKKAILDRLQRAREEAHAARALAYNLSWRLRNLGYLPDTTLLLFPLEGTALDRLLDAQRRYAHRNALKLPELNDIYEGESSDVMKALSDAIKKEHDG